MWSTVGSVFAKLFGPIVDDHAATALALLAIAIPLSVFLRYGPEYWQKDRADKRVYEEKRERRRERAARPSRRQAPRKADGSKGGGS